jgi:hypothetical protein
VAGQQLGVAVVASAADSRLAKAMGGLQALKLTNQQLGTPSAAVEQAAAAAAEQAAAVAKASVSKVAGLDEEALRATARATGTGGGAAPATIHTDIAPVHSQRMAGASIAPATVHTDVAPGDHLAPVHTRHDVAPVHGFHLPAISHAHGLLSPSHAPKPLADRYHARSTSPSHAPAPITGHVRTSRALHAPGAQAGPGAVHHDAISPSRAPQPSGSLQDELRLVAEHHRGEYAPGKVPEWLERQAGRGLHAPAKVAHDRDAAAEARRTASIRKVFEEERAKRSWASEAAGAADAAGAAGAVGAAGAAAHALRLHAAAPHGTLTLPHDAHVGKLAIPQDGRPHGGHHLSLLPHPHGRAASDAAVAAAAAEHELMEEEEHGNRRAKLALTGVSIVAILLVLARWLRRKPRRKDPFRNF